MELGEDPKKNWLQGTNRNEMGSTMERRRKSGKSATWPCTTNQTDSLLVKNYMKGKKGRSLRMAKTFLSKKGIQVTIPTIRTILKEDLGLYAYKKKKVPKLTARHRELRVSFAQENLDAEDDWSDVAWHYAPRSKYGGKSCEVWGCVTYWSKLPLIFIERPIVTGSDGKKHKRKFTSVDYRDRILKKTMTKIDALFRANQVEEWWFQQDGDAKHTSKLVQNWLKENCSNFIDKDGWPANSPDLNIIENVWSFMDTELAKYNVRTYNGLKTRIRKIWAEKLTLQYIRSLFDSIPRRFQAVVEADGYSTKY